ncbi:polyphosphate--glucose phosphotransferase [Phycicoccus sp. Soil802]|uniref:polyphosphate--glucose phosphotransferase n=1 Tax=Phycicoccus sp. Soil802 TaxID=1736414 RepID=UPI0007032005|nr:ROK family protein [Phycicoccus sp. Soil802]KRF22354.1 polyphosphate glucokinase [Phycicoccus sp. Soil802]
MSDQPDVALGIDIGGTGTKGGLVDISSGSLVSQRYRLDTPQPATPTDVSDVVAAVAARFDFAGPVGVAFPGVVLNGVAHTAANLDDSWIGSSLHQLIGPRLDGPSTFLNDADAAGLAEAHYGAARGQQGVVVVVTFGTGIGVAVINNGELVANSELGHIEIDNVEAERRAAASARERDQLTWAEWGARADTYLKALENLVWPNLIILGGGISKNPEKWLHHLNPRTPVRLAQSTNNAGIIGAADAAWMQHRADATQLIQHRAGRAIQPPAEPFPS